MINKSIYSIVALGLIFGVSPVLAMKIHIPMELETSGTFRILQLPAEAANSHVISLGTAIDPQSGKVVEGLAFIHYKKGFNHKEGHSKGKPDNGGDAEPTCYADLANGAAWKLTEDYLVDATNNAGIPEGTIETLIAEGLEVWDSEVASDIFGSQVLGVVDGVETVSPDGKNEVLFGDIDSPGAIGVTTVWGIFRGKPSNRELLEWDMELDDVDYDWSAELTGVAGKMDFLNIFVHEAGHALGLGHPGDSCVDETMYRFASEEEIKKRDLNDGDIAGVNNLYQ